MSNLIAELNVIHTSSHIAEKRRIVNSLDYIAEFEDIVYNFVNSECTPEMKEAAASMVEDYRQYLCDKACPCPYRNLTDDGLHNCITCNSPELQPCSTSLTVDFRAQITEKARITVLAPAEFQVHLYAIYALTKMLAKFNGVTG